jgi:hypothetical protein
MAAPVISKLERFLVTVSCRDCDPIPKVPSAGQVVTIDGIDIQIMHDGTKFLVGGYHGDWMADVTAMGGHIFCAHRVTESFSGDGLIVGSFFPCDRGLEFPNISRNVLEKSLFR